jgi:predicted site-specific integrase-resolvase
MSAAELFEGGSLTVNRAAAEFDVSRARLYEWMSEGKLVYTTTSGRRLIPKRAIQALLAEGLVGAVETADAAK